MQEHFQRLSAKDEQTRREQELYTQFYLLFRYAQDHVTLQDAMAGWLVDYEFIDRSLVSVAPPEYILNLEAPKHHTKPGHGNDPSRERQIKWQWASLVTHVQRSESLDYKKRLPEMTLWFVENDLGYQKPDTPRPNRKLGVHMPDSTQDQRASFVRKYILQAHPSGHQGFDSLFAQMKQVITDPYTDTPYKEIRGKVMDLSQAWEHYHPGYSFFDQ